MTDLCASPALAPRDALRLPFGVGYVVLHRGAGLAAALARAATWPARAYARRRTVALLAQMDGRQLADIGLTRSDVIEAAHESLFGDPRALLDQRARERADKAIQGLRS